MGRQGQQQHHESSRSIIFCSLSHGLQQEAATHHEIRNFCATFIVDKFPPHFVAHLYLIFDTLSLLKLRASN